MPPRLSLEEHLKEKVLPVYAFLGSERVLVAEAIATLREHVLKVAPDFNRHDFSMREASMDRVVGAARTLPMMAPVRFVHLADIDLFKGKDATPLIDYLANPVSTTVLCITGEKIDQRTKLGQAIHKVAAVFNFEPPKQKDLPSVITRRALKLGIQIAPDATLLLADFIGAEIGTLDRALEKMALHAGENQTITTEDVEATVAPTRMHSIFELTDAIGSRNVAQASILLRNLLSTGETGLPILSMIARQFRQLLRVKIALSQGVKSAGLASRLSVPPFLVHALVAQAARYQALELQHALSLALDAEIRMKSSSIDHGVILERLLLDSMNLSLNPTRKAAASS